MRNHQTCTILTLLTLLCILSSLEQQKQGTKLNCFYFTSWYKYTLSTLTTYSFLVCQEGLNGKRDYGLPFLCHHFQCRLLAHTGKQQKQVRIQQDSLVICVSQNPFCIWNKLWFDPKAWALGVPAHLQEISTFTLSLLHPHTLWVHQHSVVLRHCEFCMQIKWQAQGTHTYFPFSSAPLHYLIGLLLQNKK